MNNKELVPTLVLIFALFGGAYYYSESIQAPFVSVLNTAKTTYHDSVEAVQNAIEEHFSQQETIIAQRDEITALKNRLLEQQQLKEENAELLIAQQSGLKVDPRVELVRTLSYAKFGDTRKVWLEMQDFNTTKVYGLVREGAAAGIVVESRNQPLALLNGDPKSSYAVFVGKQRAPGIVHGNNSDTLLVKFIPTWIPIYAGDEVSTSGLDNLFFRGLKVGKVLSVTLSEGYQSAVIEPYYRADDPGYFHVIKSLR
ncbi:MAG: rod shape-determining protein MreC [Sulfurimonadaceae bacterium]|nr:rod shape-determining protein MreC [Sulfurimonadaceae bacterium]